MLVYNKQSGNVTMEPARAPEEQEVVWIKLAGSTDTEIKQVLEGLFQSHPLLVEDCIKLNQRPKLDRYRRNMLLTFFAVEPKQLAPQEIAIVVGPNYVVTVTKEPIAFLDELEQSFLDIDGRVDDAGDILYHIVDRSVDEYSEIVDHIEARVDKLERGIYRNPHIRVAQEIFRLKRHLHTLRRIFVEEKTILGAMSHQNLPFTRQERDVYFVDIYDHISRVVDSVDIFREALTGLLELQMSMKSDRMNEIMKTLTVFSTVFMPLTFIVGLYGMNFQNMPELRWTYGYPAVWAVMILVFLGMWVFFKRKKWW